MKRTFSILVYILSFFITSPVFSAHDHLEKEYQVDWCAKAGGVIEYVLDDKTRVDCLTEEYAIEFDFAPKWAEAIGQALYYSLKTGKKAGVVLIEEKDEPKNKLRLKTVADKYGIKVWIVDPGDIMSK